MAEPTRLSTTIDRIGRARGDETDAAWAVAVAWSLLRRDVDSTLVAEGLTEALDLVRATREPAVDLFGPARDHADALHQRWTEEGRLVLADGVSSWRDTLVVGLALSALLAAVLAVLLLVRGDLGTADLLRAAALALVIGLGSALGHALWSRRHRRPAPGPDSPDDARWAVELTAILRSRHSMAGPRVRGIVAEAQAHAAEAGRTVRDEFGTPEEYAARFVPDLARSHRWRTVALVGLAVLVVVQLVGGLR